ncbi:uncharacterized protein LOC106645623 [Copidosoma floridanum]|uniref:uncharacterized protein LOC106645623 n=1 Tax=Copidosoma floridanum TaxID=29053 RepID=UPI0006C9CDF0|nr:uncharacterized protein LOC106645623 [Copidosoma floridanum]
MPPRSPDSFQIVLNLIRVIKQHPILYISEVKGNVVKPQEFRQKVWKRISNELGLDISWVKQKWKNLRDTYCRILKYKNKTPKELKRKKWVFEPHLDFLKIPYGENSKCNVELSEEYIDDINREVISSNDRLDQLEESQDDDDYSEYLETLENSNATLEQEHVLDNNGGKKSNVKSPKKITTKQPIDEGQSQTKIKKIQPRKRKFNNISNMNVASNLNLSSAPKKPSLQSISSTKKSFDYDNSIDNFFQNIAQNVKKLPPKIQADIKMDVCKIVSEAEICYMKHNTLQRVQKYSNMPGMIKKLVLVPAHLIDNQIKTNKH